VTELEPLLAEVRLAVFDLDGWRAQGGGEAGVGLKPGTLALGEGEPA
jgi:hypothetical protein